MKLDKETIDEICVKYRMSVDKAYQILIEADLNAHGDVGIIVEALHNRGYSTEGISWTQKATTGYKNVPRHMLHQGKTYKNSVSKVEVRKLYDLGYSDRMIASMLKCGKTTIQRWRNLNKLKPNNRKESENDTRPIEKSKNNAV